MQLKYQICHVKKHIGHYYKLYLKTYYTYFKSQIFKNLSLIIGTIGMVTDINLLLKIQGSFIVRLFCFLQVLVLVPT